MTRDPWVRSLVIVTLAITTLYLVGMIWHLAVEFADIILIFFLAWMLAFVIEPTAAPLHEKLKLPRTLAIAVTYLALLILMLGGGLILAPPLTAQVVQISTNLPGYAEELNRWFLFLQAMLAERGLHLNLATLIAPDEVVRRAEAAGPPLLANVVNLAAGVANIIFQTVVVIMLSFYFALDGRRFAGIIVEALPLRFRDDGHYFFDSVNRAFAGFLRGQLVLAAVYAIGTGAIMRIVELPYGLLTSVLAGVLMLIPFLGPFLALAVPLTIAALSRADAMAIVFLASVGLQQIVFNIIAPRVMSQSVGLHPLLVFFVVLAGARLAGVWGALFGVPIVAVVSAMLAFYRSNLASRGPATHDATEAQPSNGPLPPSEIVEVTQA